MTLLSFVWMHTLASMETFCLTLFVACFAAFSDPFVAYQEIPLYRECLPALATWERACHEAGVHDKPVDQAATD